MSLRAAVADQLTREYGRGHWSSCPTEQGVLRGLRTSRVLVARAGTNIVGTVRLATKKPWAIDLAYFRAVPKVTPKALYLHDMAVAPDLQGRGIGRCLVKEAIAAARAWPSEALRRCLRCGRRRWFLLREVWLQGSRPGEVSEHSAHLLRAPALTRRRRSNHSSQCCDRPSFAGLISRGVSSASVPQLFRSLQLMGSGLLRLARWIPV